MIHDFNGKVKIIGYVLMSEGQFINEFENGPYISHSPLTIKRSIKDMCDLIKTCQGLNRYKNLIVVPLMVPNE